MEEGGEGEEEEGWVLEEDQEDGDPAVSVSNTYNPQQDEATV